MEVAKSGKHWMEPGDYDVNEFSAWRGPLRRFIHPIVDDRIHVLFADGEIWALAGETPIEELVQFFTNDNANSHSKEEVLGKYCVMKWTSPGIAAKLVKPDE
jgi:hypothetical protein